MPIGELDCIFKAWVKYTQSYICVTCPYWGRVPATENLQSGHVITAVKWASCWVPMVHWQMPNLQSFAQISTMTIHAGYYVMVAVDELRRLAWSKKGLKYTVGDLQPLIEEFEVSAER